MRQLPVREGLEEIFVFVKKQYFQHKLGVKSSGWMAQCMKRMNTGTGDYVRHFFPEEVDKMNVAIQDLSREIITNVDNIPDTYNRQNREYFMSYFGLILEQVKSKPLIDEKVANIREKQWSDYTTIKEGRRKLYLTDEQVKAIKDKLRSIADFIADIELEYESL